MNLRILAFTDRGYALACRIAALTGAKADRCGDGQLYTWTEQAFAAADTLLYIGAAGIAVRAIAPFVCHKVQDPAVLVADEMGRYVIPILSGHLGGANEAAADLADRIGGTAVITTATDLNGLFAADVWAKRQNCMIPNPERIKQVSGALLRQQTVGVFTEFPISGTLPAGLAKADRLSCDLAISVHTWETEALFCVPRCLVLGVGCKKNTPFDALENTFSAFLQENHLQESAVCKVCSVELKKDEPGLLEFCRRHGFDFVTFPVEQLNRVPGLFTGSEFVKKTTGTDNVCERSAVCGSGGTLLVHKTADSGVTMAAALAVPDLNWG